MRRYKLTEKQLDMMEDKRLLTEFWQLVDRESITEYGNLSMEQSLVCSKYLFCTMQTITKALLVCALLRYHQKSREIHRNIGMIE